ncbi:hypothetical protein Slin15195_G085070 [Septoria linicola]|uniref:Uncharacterized protein n=1 Tax=Septoria linicola TaxID=215465 RepID=A0A9Q9EN68_9PEZI|nr:hypothetical protein Slin15195_G085070 [Septoria linicola]
MASSTSNGLPPAYGLRDIAALKVRDKATPNDEAPDLERNNTSSADPTPSVSNCEKCKSLSSTKALAFILLGLVALGFGISGLYLFFT